eukprot:scaffold4136_cov101-Isochrysis_galbana.AAC.5
MFRSGAGRRDTLRAFELRLRPRHSGVCGPQTEKAHGPANQDCAMHRGGRLGVRVGGSPLRGVMPCLSPKLKEEDTTTMTQIGEREKGERHGTRFIIAGPCSIRW